MRYLFLFLALTLPGFALTAMDLGFDVTGSNLNFNPNRSPVETEYSPYYLPAGFGIYGQQNIDSNIDIDFGLRSDRILKNYVYGSFMYSGDYFSLQVGPYAGVVNSSQVPVKPGIIASVKIQSPGKVFLLLRSARSINLLNVFTGNEISGTVSDSGDYLQEDNIVSLGFYAMNTIASFNVHSKIFTEKTSEYGVVSDSQTDYSFSTEIFQKNTPFQIGISFIYRNLSKIYEDLSVEHTIGSLLLGTRIDYSLNKTMKIFADLESSVYSFGLGDLIGEFGSTSYLFAMTAGFKMSLDPYFKKD